MNRRALLSLGGLLFAACASGAGSDAELAEKLALGLAAACPDARPDDELARNTCSAELTDFALLRDSMANPFLWGGQVTDGVWALDDHVTRFDPRVFRRLYLSLYSFTPEHTVEALPDGRTLLHLKPRFRNQLDMGSYPYPFWHRQSKWDSYQLAQEVVLILKNRRILGAQRSLEAAADRPLIEHEFGGQWQWSKGGQLMPFASLYTYLFSSENPHVPELEAAYRNLEFAFRQENCLVCHSPENGAAQAQLELFNYPNQALSGRHRIVTQLEGRLMPTRDPARGYTLGVLRDERKRPELIDLAKTFARLGDDALQWEGER